MLEPASRGGAFTRFVALNRLAKEHRRLIHAQGYQLFTMRARPVLTVLIALAVLSGGWSPARAQELLEPGEAFRVEASRASPESVAITWRIAEGHYMYRQRFAVKAPDDGVSLGKPAFPDGRRKHDEFFGEMEVYDSDVTFTVPVRGTDGAFTLEATGQGCNEPVGVCYPPTTHTVQVQPAAAPQSSLPGAQSSASGDDGVLQDLLQGGTNRAEFLHPDDAFRFETTVMDHETLLIRFFIEPGYYLYKDKFDLRAVGQGLRVSSTELPAGELEVDEYFGESRVFRDMVDLRVELARDAPGAGTAELRIGYQGCAEDGICYPPIEKTVSVALPGEGEAPLSAIGVDRSGGGQAWNEGAWPVLMAFGAGLLLTFTPCVLPMIPILGGVIVGQGRAATRLRGGALAAVYVLGTAVTYTGVGIVAGLTGDQLQAYFQNIWAVGIVAGLLVLMALAMFGLFELAMPTGIQSRLHRRAAHIKRGAFGGAFVLGMISALIVGACVSPVLISVLSLAITRGDPWLGGAIMFAMALGMGAFLVVVGLGFGHVLPRAGPWMTAIKHVFGVMLLAVAVYLLGAVPQVPVMYLWAALLAGVALFLGAGGGARKSLGRKLARQAAALALAAWAVLAVIGGLQGGRDILRPVDTGALLGDGGQTAVHARFRTVSTPGDLAERMQAARAQGKPVMVDYYADWCVDCVRMEKTTFSDPRVADALNDGFVLVQVDVTDPNAPGPRAIKQSHGIYGPPAMLFFNARGEEVSGMRRYGYMDSEAFLRHIEPLR